ncbi:MAG: hypothetical protein D6705_05920 [Deltaproteobacteria bacterium]|nr:MAG: hypothetical protein D6705_05920 [Deltaproteobacteria bacterium]
MPNPRRRPLARDRHVPAPGAGGDRRCRPYGGGGGRRGHGARGRCRARGRRCHRAGAGGR